MSVAVYALLATAATLTGIFAATAGFVSAVAFAEDDKRSAAILAIICVAMTFVFFFCLRVLETSNG